MADFAFKSVGKTASQIATSPVSNISALSINATAAGSMDLNATALLPIGIKTPLKTGKDDLFSMHYSIQDQVHDNLRNLLLTNWGERVGFYNFGANLRELTTEIENIEAFDEAAIERIRNAVTKWMPFVTLKEFSSKIDNMENPQTKTGVVKIMITYSVPQLGLDNKALQISLYVT